MTPTNMNIKKLTTLKTILLALVLTISVNQLFAQTTNGIFFQAVARDNFSNPAKDRKIYIQSSIIQNTPTGTKVLTEEHQANTDAMGVFSISLGNGVRVGGTSASLANIDWSKGPFYLNLKVSITPIGGNSSWDYTKEWVDMGTTSFGAVPFALYSASSAKVDDKLNATDTTKMLAVYAKAMSVKTLETSLATKLNAADTLTMLAPYAKAAYTIDSNFFKTQLATKLNLSDTLKYTKKLYTDSVVNTKLNIADSAKYVTPRQLASYNFSNGGGTTIDTTSLSNRINVKANTSDFAILTTVLGSKLNITDTINLLHKQDSVSLSNRINLKLNVSQIGVANGVASLNALGIIPSSQLAPVTLSSTSVVGSDADMIALSSAKVGSIAIRTDLNKNYVLSALPADTLSNWVELLTPAAPVQTVNGYTGAINLTKTDIGLSDVDNVADISKPISNTMQAALNLKLDANKLGLASGVASLNALGKIPSDQIPAISFSSVKVLTNQSAMLALNSAVIGSVVIRTDVNKNYVLAQSDPSVLSNWIELLTPAPPVQTVNGYSGNISLTKSDIDLSNAENTSDANKPVSTATQTALDLKATKDFVTTSITSGNATNTADIIKLKTSIASNTASITATTAALALKASIYLALKSADAYTLSDINAGNIIYSQWTARPRFPESLSDGFYCTIVNYSGGAITSNVLTTAKFYTNATGYAGASSFTIPPGGSANVYAIKILSGGILSQRYYILAGDQSAVSIADASITNAKLAGNITASKLVGNDIVTVGTITAGTWSGTTISVANGGSGSTSLSGYVKGNGTSPLTSSSTIPASDITGLIKKINGASPASDGNVTVSFGSVTTGTFASRPYLAGSNGNIYVVSGDATTADNGRTYISDGTNWNEVTSNQSATDARYLQLSGGTLSGDLTIPTSKLLTIIDAPTNNSDATNKSYVDAAISNITINDASISGAGKIQLAGDLAGAGTSATNPKISSVGGSTASLINSAEILANASVSANSANQLVKRDASGNFSAGTISANLTGDVIGNVTGNISGTALNVTGVVTVANGGTGTNTLTGYIKGNGSSILTGASTIPSTDITGLIKTINGSGPASDGNVTVSFGTVTTGTLSSRPLSAGTNGNIYVVSNDGTTTENGRTFISDGTNWKEVTSNQSATDARYLKLAGGTMAGNIIIPTTNKITITDAPSSSTDAVNKAYVDGFASSGSIVDASTSTLGKIQLTGDLAGAGTSATNPKVSSVGGSTAALINSAELAANAATYSNTANQIVKRDASGNFSAGTITANVTGNITGNATNVTGVVLGVNGGTGIANNGKTITLGGNLETGAASGPGHNVKFVTTLSTTVTLPTSGTLATVAQVDTKELLSNKSTATDLGNTLTSDDKYPSQKAVKTYVDGKVSTISTVGTITSGTWSASAISVSKGGTGLTAAGTNGQFLTSTSAGTLTWTTVASGGGNTHTIGEQYGGGIVFYVWDNGAHGLVVAKNEIGSKGPLDYTSTVGVIFTAGAGSSYATAFRSGIGAGFANTTNIIAKSTYYNQPFIYTADLAAVGTIYAALIAQQYANATNVSTPLFGDWYLPSKYELELLKTNLTLISGSGFNITHDYWSSTEVNSGYAYYYKSADGNVNNYRGTNNTAFVIPIRQF